MCVVSTRLGREGPLLMLLLSHILWRSLTTDWFGWSPLWQLGSPGHFSLTQQPSQGLYGRGRHPRKQISTSYLRPDLGKWQDSTCWFYFAKASHKSSSDSRCEEVKSHCERWGCIQAITSEKQRCKQLGIFCYPLFMLTLFCWKSGSYSIILTSLQMRKLGFHLVNHSPKTLYIYNWV